MTFMPGSIFTNAGTVSFPPRPPGIVKSRMAATKRRERFFTVCLRFVSMRFRITADVV
jgi:hypothetical protein